MNSSSRRHAVLLCLWFARAASSQPAYRVKDIDPRISGTLSSNPTSFVKSGRAVFFSAFTPATGRELWRTDGTAGGTTLVRDLAPGPASGLAPDDGTEMVDVGGVLLFTARNAWQEFELWKSDGSDTGTVLVKRFEGDEAGSWPRHLTNANGVLFFTLMDRRDHDSVWTSDGTEAGTRRVVERVYMGCHPANPASPCFPFRSVALGKRVVFADAVQPRGTALWITDGTPSGTVEIARFQGIDLFGSSLAVASDTLFFAADDGHAWALYASDGTSAGTRRLAEVVPFAATDLHGALVFWNLSRRDENAKLELWRSDGTARGTVRLRVLFEEASWWFPPFRDGGSVLFRTAEFQGLWRTDGTLSGTGRASVADAPDLIALGDRLVFAGDDPEHGTELWASDGTERGTALVRDLDDTPNARGSHPSELTDVGGTLFFVAGTEAAVGRELWRSDGTDAGTLRVADLGDSITSLTSLGRLAVFIAEGGVWKSDGVRLLRGRLEPLANRRDPRRHAPDRAVRSATSGPFASHERFRHALLHGGRARRGGSGGAEHSSHRRDRGRLHGIALGDGRLLFATESSETGAELWTTDGTAEGTGLVEDINPGPASALSRVPSFAVSGNRVFFAADDGVHGMELWALPLSTAKRGAEVSVR